MASQRTPVRQQTVRSRHTASSRYGARSGCVAHSVIQNNVSRK